MSDGGRLARHVAGSAFANIWLMVLALATTPYILFGLGSAAYGVFAIVGVVSAHLANLELGFGHATVRYLAQARAACDTTREREVLETSFSVFLAAALVAAGMLFLSASSLVSSFFRVEVSLRQESVHAFQLGGIILGCSFISSFFTCALQALGRFDWLNWSRIAFGTLAAVTPVAAVAGGGGLQAVFVAQAGVAVLSSVVLGMAVASVRGEGVWPRVSVRTLKEMAAYGVTILLGGIAYQWMINGPPLVLGAYVSTDEIPPFSIALMVLQRLTMLVTSASLVFLPFASAAAAIGARAHLAAVFTSHLRLTILVMGPMVGFLLIFSSRLLAAWVSVEFAAEGAAVLRLLAAAALVLALGGPPADIARGLGRPGWVLAYTVAVAIVGLGMSVAIIPVYGAIGAALALFVGILLGTPPLLCGVARLLLGLTAGQVASSLAGPIAAVLIVTACYGAGKLMVAGIVAAMITGCVATAAYAAAVYFWILAPGERRALHSAAGRA